MASMMNQALKTYNEYTVEKRFIFSTFAWAGATLVQIFRISSWVYSSDNDINNCPNMNNAALVAVGVAMPELVVAGALGGFHGHYIHSNRND